ncbi:SpoIIE family protein phosphatase [Streptomyces sp. NPDC002073]
MASRRDAEEPSAGPIWSEPGSLLGHVAVAVFGIDGDGRLCFWGPGAQELFGHSAQDVLGRPAGMLFPEPEASVRLAERARALGYWRVRMPGRHRDGTVFDCGFRVFPVSGPADPTGGTAPTAPPAPAVPTGGTAPSAPAGPPTGPPPDTGRSVVMGLASRGDELDRVKTNLVFLDSLFETCPIGLVMIDEELRYVHLNQALADMDGIPLADHIGRRMDEIMLTRDEGEYLRMLRGVIEGGPPVVGTLVGLRTPGHPDRDQVRSVSFFPLSGAGDTRRGAGGLLLDVTDREQAILEATAARRRLELLDQAAGRIGTSLDVNVTARELVDAVVPDFCDGAVVEIVQWADESADFDPQLPVVTRRIAAGTTLPPPAPELVSGLQGPVTYPPGSSIHEMLRTGRPLCFPVDRDFVTRTVVHQERAQLLLDSGLACILIAPLVARGRVQGITMFGRSAARPAFAEPDLRLAGELASRAALCLDNARLYSHVQDIALTLQRALLPSAPATSPHLEIAHRYLPGSRLTEVGGDWYDVIALPHDRIALVVGDVMGHGVPAAAAMGRLRITAKTLARHTTAPEELLAELDWCAQEAGIELATCAYLVYDPRTGRARLGNAGHPPPLLRYADGSVDTLGEVLGVPLGVGGVPFRSAETALPDGAVLALYTDGLIEVRGRDLEAGLAALRRALAEEPGRPGSLDEAADRILARLLPDAPTDDTVLLLARVHRP